MPIDRTELPALQTRSVKALARIYAAARDEANRADAIKTIARDKIMDLLSSRDKSAMAFPGGTVALEQHLTTIFDQRAARQILTPEVFAKCQSQRAVTRLTVTLIGEHPTLSGAIAEAGADDGD